MKKNKVIIALLLLLGSMVNAMAQDDRHWQCDIYAYEHDMALNFRLTLDGAPVANTTDYEVAAFVDDECRGIAEYVALTAGGEPNGEYGYLRIRSNQTEGETVNLKVYQHSTGKTYAVPGSIPFQAQTMVGLPSEPYEVNILSVELGDVNTDGTVNMVDAVALVNYILKKPSALFMEQAADLNGDGKIDMVDAVSLVNIILGKNY